MRESKLGSLFDGSGGFPLAGALNGIKPVWASEIEPFPIRVTKARFPSMKHLGDVAKICGSEIEPVDIITFGSPCQDLSAAGKQLGIHEGQRSNLFFEAIRIIKEMREHDRATGRADDDLRPRFAVWENVPGAFSSNKGADFQAVLQAFCNIMEDGLHIPRHKKWNHAGCVAGNGWSLAWRVYDAQYWPGTPQRRKRIYLIADFGSERAGEILFECEGVYGNPAEGRETGEGTSADAEGSAGRGCAFLYERLSVFDARGNGDGEIAPTITGDHENRITDYTAVCVGNGQLHQTDLGDKAGALNCMHDQQAIITQGKPPRKYVVRRLTPLECCRLQGFPDYWTDGVEGSDSAKYKMWGNGIALPCAVDVIGRIAKELRKEESQ